MADSKITDLTELTAVDPDADFVEIVDTSATQNKKVKPRRFSRWELAASWTHSGNVTEVDFTGLSAYSELMILFKAVTLGTSGVLTLVVSSDNGSTWKTASGEYSFININGVSTDFTSINPYNTSATAARSGVTSIIGWNLANPKPVITARSDTIGWVVNDAEACNAIRAIPSGGGNITGGSIYIFGR